MSKLFSRAFYLLCLVTVTFAGGSRAVESHVSSNIVESPHNTVAHDRRDGESAWPETAQMVLLGAGLTYVGSRLGKRKA